MKTRTFLAAIGMLLTTALSSYSNEILLDKSKTINIKSTQLFFGDQGLFGYIEGEWVPLSEVHFDDQSGYLAVIRTRWICPICLYNNPEHAETCQRYYQDTGVKCGYPRPKK